MTVPGTSLRLPSAYPQAGGVAIVAVGANGNAYYQFSDPAGAFVGQPPGSADPAAFNGNPFTINSPISLNCGFSSCSDYFGGSISRIYIRFTAFDGDTGSGEFDFNDITLRLNGFDVANWSTIRTEITNNSGTTSGGFRTGFTDQTLNTGWFETSNAALLSNILSTGRTTTQVFDRDIGDNFWNFRIGDSLADPGLRTVAPGYNLTKTANPTTFTAVGQTITYTYVVSNIGSVTINNLSVADDKIANVSCNKTSIVARSFQNPAGPDTATCTATYVITQADFDAQAVTNVAAARGTPAFGSLGELRATATVTGPALAPSVSMTKTTTASAFGVAGATVPYTLTARNTGNATLRNVVVTDPLLPGLSCTVATLAPNATQVCNVSYTVTQADVDNWARNGTPLRNTASVTARDPRNTTVNGTSTQVSLPGPTPVVTLTMDKVAQVTTFAAPGDVIPYRFIVRNTGNTTWPGPPTVTDSLAAVSCPTGAVAPGASITCTANYTVTQANIDAGQVVNTANASVTVGTTTGTATDTETVRATRTTTMTLDKRLAATSPTAFADAGVTLQYEFALRNTGNTTLNTVAVSDPLITNLTCPQTTIAPGATLVCTGSYVTTQANLDAGQVVNTANATARAAGTNTVVTAPADSQTVPATRAPALTIDKVAPTVPPAQFTVGRQITYSFTVTNSGNVALPGPIRIEDPKTGNFQCQAGGLARNATATCTRTYTLTQADVDNGTVVNTATATAGTTTTGITRSPGDTATIAPVLQPAITLSKSASPGSVSGTQDDVDYSFTITNSGNTTIDRATQPITVTDPNAPPVICPATPVTLAPGDTLTCLSENYRLTQEQVDAGRYVNRATASFPFTNGGQTVTIRSNEATATVLAVGNADVQLDKTGPARFDTVGQVISYAFTITNTGAQTLRQVRVTDPRIPGLSCTFAAINPAVIETCTANYTVTQADVDAGVINNTATVTAGTSRGQSLSDTGTATTPINPAFATRSAEVTKLANATTFRAGQRITYTLRVTNTGRQTLTNLAVTDSLDPGYSCTVATLAPGAVSNFCTFAYTATQADVDAGRIQNTGTVSGSGITTDTDTLNLPPQPRTARYTFAKEASGPFTAAGNVVTFTLPVENTGTTTLTNVTITDAFFDPDLTCTIASLAPGAINRTCTAAYTVTQADVNAGRITNTASITATPPAGVTLQGPTTATAVVQGPTPRPAVVVTKTATPTTFALGDTVTYTFSVQNTGNVSLTNIAVADAALGFSCNVANLAPNTTATTCQGGAPLQATRVMTQADVDRGSFQNRATVSARSAGTDGATVRDDDEVTAVGPTQAPTVSVDKTATTANFDAVGDVVSYQYLVRNTGNITLTAPITISDDRIPNPICPALPAGGLAPNATLTCTGTYTATQADIDASSVTNVATARTRQPVVPRNPGDPTTVDVVSSPDTVTVPAVRTYAIALDKALAAGSPRSFAIAGDTLTYAYTIRNTGNATITGPIAKTDDRIPGSVNCLPAGQTLAPGASVTCTRVWTATQAAVDAGEIENTALASFTVNNPGPVTVNATDSLTVPATRAPRLTIVKDYVADTPADVFTPGEVLNYRYVVTNSGNVTVNGPITVADDQISTVTCPAGNLIPGASLTCTATYTVTSNDITLGSVTNTASASGTTAQGPVTSAPDSAVFPVDAQPAISVAKAVTSGGGFDSVGDLVSYTFTITNTGNVALGEDIFVDDDKIGRFQVRIAADPDLPPFNGGANAAGRFTVTRTYPVTQADLDRGFVTNVAAAETVFAPASPDPKDVNSPPVEATANAATDPELTVAKSVTAGPNPAPVGAVLTYTVTVTNTGNQTVRDVTVADPLIPGLTCTGSRTLAPTDVLTCTGTYTVTQADVDAQVLTNTATANGVLPGGSGVSDSGDTTHPLATPAGGIEVTKAVTPDPGSGPAFTAVGQEVTFAVTVRNTGNVTLTDVRVTDDLVPGTCTVARLAVGASDSSCRFTYTTVQADLDRVFGAAPNQTGGVENIARASALPANPGATRVTDDGSVVAVGPAQVRRFALDKLADQADFDAPGDVLTYRYTVTNTGNVTLTQQPVVSDNRIASVACPALPSGGLAPGASITCTASFTVAQADLDQGQVVNVATVASPEAPLPNPAGDAQATATVPAVRTPAMTVDKTADPTGPVAVGQVITYTYVVRNTGNVTLTAVTPTDRHTSAAGTVTLAVAGDALANDAAPTGDSPDGSGAGIWGTLAPQDSVRFTATYTVTQDDVDAARALTNTVTVAATSPTGTTSPTATDTASVPVVAAAPALVLVKTADTSGLSTPPAAGQIITWTITADNPGNVTLQAPVLSDTLRDGRGNAIALTTGPTFSSGDTDGDRALDVDETWSYTATYRLTQGVLDSGGVSNVVTGTAVTPNGTEVTDTADNGTPADEDGDGDPGNDPTATSFTRSPALDMVKTAAFDDRGNGSADAGDTVFYTYEVTNTGNVTVFDLTVTETGFSGTGTTPLPAYIRGGADVGGNAALIDLRPGQTARYTVTYTLTQDDIDAGQVENQATAAGEDPDGGPVSDLSGNAAGGNDPTVVTFGRTPALVVNKTASTAGLSSPPRAGEVVTYTITLRNAGNVRLRTPTFADTLTDANGTVLPVGTPTFASGDDGNNLLDVGETWSYTLPVTLTPAILDAGGLQNTVTVTMRDPANQPQTDVSDDNTPGSDRDGDGNAGNDPTVTPLTRSPALTVDKTIVGGAPTAPAVGTVVTFNIAVANTGNVTLTAPTLTDVLRDGTGATVALTSGPTLNSGDANTNSRLDAGETWVYRATITLTQTLLDSGGLTNTATFSGTDPQGNPTTGTDDVTVPLTRTPGIAVTKSAVRNWGSNSILEAGETITYTYVVRNTGNATLFDVGVTETTFTGTGTTPVPVYVSGGGNFGGNATIRDLRPGTSMSFRAVYVTTQADIDAGTVTNQATGRGNLTGGGQATDLSGSNADNDTPTVVTIPPRATLVVIKSADVSALANPPVAGDVVSFTISARSTGNVSLSTVTITDTLTRNGGGALTLTSGPTLSGGDVGRTGVLEIGETWVWTATYALTQADIDAGGIANSATVRALRPDGTPVTDVSDDGLAPGANDPTRVPLVGQARIAGEKTVTSAPTPAGAVAGDRVVFAITATNTGNVTLTGVGVPTDTLLRADGTALTLTGQPTFVSSSAGSPAGRLAPGETATYRASYVLTQADIDAGGIRNSAIVRGTPPTGPAVTDTTDNGNDTDGNTTNDPTEFLIPANPSLDLVKRLAADSLTEVDSVGDLISYEFVVTNSGNVSIQQPVTIDDPLITNAGGSIDCPAPPIAPGASITCTGSYAVTQADLDAGEVVNSATASDGNVTSDPSGRTVPAVQEPALAVVKQAEAVAAADYVVGLVVNYTYAVTNAGNVTITAPITINDNLIPAANLSCPALPAGGLAPEAVLTCTGSYTVTADDVDLGRVTNNASATDGTTTSPLTSETIPDATSPALTLVKTAASTDPLNAVDDEVTYTFTVTNTGTRAFVAPVVIDDPLLTAPVTCFTPTASDPDFRAGETAICTGTYTITQDDLDRGRVVNEATASSTFGGGSSTVTSPPATATIPLTLQGGVTLTKSADPATVTTAGQIVTFTLVAENTGNRTLRNIEVTDPMLPDLSCAIAVLAPGDELSCDADYTVTQADLDRGTLVNTGRVTANDPDGTAVTDTGTTSVTLPARNPSLAIEKTATPSPFGAVGSEITWRLTVTNDGNVTMQDITVTDVIDPDYSCAIATLAPGAVNDDCSLTMTVTQAMVDAGEVVNTASVSGEGPDGTVVDASDELNTAGPASAPGLEATKVLLASATTPGSVVRYELRLRNTGNVTLTAPAVTDTMERNDGTAVALTVPFALRSGDTDNDTRLDVGETWVYRGSRTLQQADVDAGGLTNTVTATADAPDGGDVSDVSDNGNDGDGNTANDPTVLTITPGPALTVTKVVASSEGLAPGDDVVFRITALNSGNVSLTDVTVADTLTRFDGTAVAATAVRVSGADPLPPGSRVVWTVTHSLTQADIDAGGLRNTATVTGEDPDGDPVSDVSADDDNGDGNTTDDPTDFEISPEPGLTVVKRVASIGTAAGEEAVFTITVRNSGNLTLTDLEVDDTLSRRGGGEVGPVTTTFVRSSRGSPEGTLRPAETATYRATYTLVQADVDAGGLVNTAVATGRDPDDNVVTDTSDNGGGDGDDPTEAAITAEGTVAVTKDAGRLTALFPTVDRVTFTIRVENTGNVTQTRLRVSDDLRGFLSPAVLLDAYPVTVEVAGFGPGRANADFDGVTNRQLLAGNATLAPGAAGTIRVTFTYSTAAGQPGTANVARASGPNLPDPEPSNPAEIGRDDTDGDGIPDDVEGPGDRDGDGVPNARDFDPTGAFYCVDDGRILPGGSIRVVRVGGGGTQAITVVDDGSDGGYRFFVTAPGRYRLEITYPPGSAPATDRPSAGTLDVGTFRPADLAVLGSGEDGSSGVLADPSAEANVWYTTFDVAEGDPFFIGNNIPVAQCSAQTEVAASKVADRSTAVIGESVTYTLTFENPGAATFPDARFVDVLPSGMVYTPGTGRLNGAEIEPRVSGNRLTWGPRDLGGGETVTIRLVARVSGQAAVGDMVNEAFMLNADGEEVSNTATAIVRRVPEAVFDCSDVIGKVFDDRNRNGIQDYSDPRAAITDQDIFLDKYGKLAPPAPEELQGEPGIAGVRIATVNGLLITTDEYGRFHVPCAALPAGIGSNFTLKLDERTLPVGFAMVTENPRTLRLTPGKAARMNFGAALTEVVDIALTAQAFVEGTNDPRQGLTDGVAALVARIADTPSTLRLTYLMAADEAEAVALARLQAVERMIRAAWAGAYDLRIDKSVGRAQ